MLANMLNILSTWLADRRTKRRRIELCARRLIMENEQKAYYTAQRLAARSRANRDRNEFWHWARVAAEVARTSRVAEMDLNTVQAIADEELARQTGEK